MFSAFSPQKNSIFCEFLRKIPKMECKKMFFSEFLILGHLNIYIRVIYKKNQSLTSLFGLGFRDSSKNSKNQKSPRGSANSSLVCKFDQDRVFTTLHSVISIKFPFQWSITTPFTSWVKQKCF